MFKLYFEGENFLKAIHSYIWMLRQRAANFDPDIESRRTRSVGLKSITGMREQMVALLTREESSRDQICRRYREISYYLTRKWTSARCRSFRHKPGKTVHVEYGLIAMNPMFLFEIASRGQALYSCLEEVHNA